MYKTIKLSAYLDKIKANIITPNIDSEAIEINDCYVSDMLSDVLGSAKENQVWITIMKHLNVVAVAAMTNVPCIVFAKSTMPDPSVIDKAIQEDVLLAVSSKSVFELAGILYKMID